MDNRNNADENKHAIQTDAKFESKDKSHLLVLPYQGEKDSLLKSILPSTVNANIGFTGKMISTFYEFPKE